MQSRRRFFCARVELVQLARAFLCPAPPQPTAAPPGRSPQGTPPGYSIPAAPGKAPQSRPQRRTGASNPQPRTDTAENAIYSPTEPRRAGVLSLYYHSRKRRTAAHRAAHRGQAAGGYRNAGEGKPTAATAPAQHPGQKSGRFSVIFRAFFCHFSRLCLPLPVDFIVESRKSKVESR